MNQIHPTMEITRSGYMESLSWGGRESKVETGNNSIFLPNLFQAPHLVQVLSPDAAGIH
jgi:hypothetical protein